MTVCDQPIARIQDLIDRLKNLTKPIGEAETKNLPAAWNELEDLIIMVATTHQSIDVRRKADTLASIIAAIDDYRETEKRDADSDKEPGRIDQHRGSSDGDSSGDEGRASEAGHTSTETD